MKPRRSLYSRPEIVRGEQCAEAPLTAGGATEQLPAGGVAVSRAGGGLTAEPSWLPSAACAAPHRNTVRRPAGRRLVVAAQMSGCLPWLGRPVRILGQRPRVRCQVSSVRACDVRASGVQCPGVRVSGCPGVHCPGCPASVSARSASPSASVVSAPVTSWSASVDSHTARAMVWPPCCIRERLGQRPEPEPRLCAGAGRAGQRRRRLDLVVVVEALGQRTGFDRMAGQGPPVEQDRPSVWEQVCALCNPKLWHGGAQAVRGRVGGMRPTMTWAGRRRRPRVGLGVVDLGPGSPPPAGPWLDGCGGRAAPVRPKRSESTTVLGTSAL